MPKVGTSPPQRRWYSHAYNRLVLYRLVALCAPLLPRPVRLRVARAVATLLRQYMPREYAAVQRNLTRLLPTASAAEVERQAQALFRNFACFFADLLSLNRALPRSSAMYTACTDVTPGSRAGLSTGLCCRDGPSGQLGPGGPAAEHVWEDPPCAHGPRARCSPPSFLRQRMGRRDGAL